MPPDKAMLVGGERTNLTEVNLLPKGRRITRQSPASLDSDMDQAAINQCEDNGWRLWQRICKNG